TRTASEPSLFRASDCRSRVIREMSSSAGKSPRFSLASLLLVPLMLSPAFLSVREVFNIVAPSPDGYEPFWVPEVFGIAFAYALLLTLFWYRRTRALGLLNHAQPFRWCLFRGALCGALFAALFFLPQVVTTGVVEGRKMMKPGGGVSVTLPDGS